MNMKVKRLSTKRMAVLSAVIAVVVLAMAGTTLAVLMDKSENVKNIFNPTEVTCEVYEDFRDGQEEKKNVKIKNTGDVDAYIRAAIVVTWQKTGENDEAVVASVTPEKGEDYSLVLNLAADENTTGWVEKGGYYYFNKIVSAEDFTDKLIESCKVLKSGPDGYTLSVEIIADAIQADGVNANGTKAVVDAWGVDPEELQ